MAKEGKTDLAIVTAGVETKRWFTCKGDGCEEKLEWEGLCDNCELVKLKQEKDKCQGCCGNDWGIGCEMCTLRYELAVATKALESIEEGEGVGPYLPGCKGCTCGSIAETALGEIRT
jgi:hypothetical protein